MATPRQPDPRAGNKPRTPPPEPADTPAAGPGKTDGLDLTQQAGNPVSNPANSVDADVDHPGDASPLVREGAAAAGGGPADADLTVDATPPGQAAKTPTGTDADPAEQRGAERSDDPSKSTLTSRRGSGSTTDRGAGTTDRGRTPGGV